MKKMCPRCGIIFDATPTSNFCSEKCRKLFQLSGHDVLKGRTYGSSNKNLPGGDANTEISRPQKKN